ncbi:ATP-dependent RNA helicase RhlB [Marinicellulosiphila megalodicopiae]|uniref:ATP-dependent RNA helicase RhlB n=1 Tax=Marinicellulosiphila megalodicopiae TaxID=2724896 RepID=UPI003BB02A18
MTQDKTKPSWTLEQFVVEEQEGKSRFHDFELPIQVMRAISDLGYEYASPIQAQTLPFGLAGMDCVGKAQTGTGKTAAFLLTLITDFLDNPLKKQYDSEPRSIILAPTRELAMQIADDAKLLCKYTKLKVVTIVGGMDFEKQKQSLEQDTIDILVATPGRLIDFIKRKSVFLDQVETLVIDEADRMLDMGFIPDIKQIVRATPKKEDRHTLLYSATFTDDVLNLAKAWTIDAQMVEVVSDVQTSDNVDQKVYLVSNEEKYPLLLSTLKGEDVERVIVFANRRDLVRKLQEKLKKDGLTCEMLSGEIPQAKRVKTLEKFKAGKLKYLVATDVAGRGIHIDGISHVVNFTLPEVAEDYVHRIGRTGRAGKKGTSVSFACEDDSFLLPEIEKYIGQKLKAEYPPEPNAEKPEVVEAKVETPTEVKAEIKAEPVATELKTETPVADETKVEEAKVEEAKVEEAKVEAAPVAELKVETAAQTAKPVEATPNAETPVDVKVEQSPSEVKPEVKPEEKA